MCRFWLAEMPNTSLEEISLAYRLAVKGETQVEVIPAVNPYQFGKVWKAYKAYRSQNEDLRRALESKNAASVADPQPSEAEIFQIMYRTLQAAYTTVEGGDTYPDPGNALYDWLDSKGIIPFTHEQKLEIWEEAKPLAQTLAANHAESSNLGVWQRKPFKDLVAQIMGGITTERAKNYVRAQAKYLALDRLLRDLVDMGITPDEFVSEYQPEAV